MASAEQAQDEIVQSITLVCALWVSGITRGQLRFDCLCQRLFEMSITWRRSPRPCLTISRWVFISRSRIVKDAQRHGLTVLPIDVTRSEWECTLEQEAGGRRQEAGKTKPTMRIGLRYVKGLREEAGRALVRERERAPFTSIEDLARRVPELRKNELEALAAIGALNAVSSFEFPVSRKTVPGSQFSVPKLHRREALWQVAAAGQPVGALLQSLNQNRDPSTTLAQARSARDDKSLQSARDDDSGSRMQDAGGREQEPEIRNSKPESETCPLVPMNDEERLVADYRGTGMTVGPHPMAYRRSEMQQMGVHSAIELQKLPNGKRLKIAGTSSADSGRGRHMDSFF